MAACWGTAPAASPAIVSGDGTASGWTCSTDTSAPCWRAHHSAQSSARRDGSVRSIAQSTRLKSDMRLPFNRRGRRDDERAVRHRGLDVVYADAAREQQRPEEPAGGT